MRVRKNALEWTVFALALLIVIGCIVVLTLAIFRIGDDPPDLIVMPGVAERVSSGFRVPVNVRNDGDETASQVRVSLALQENVRDVEFAELTIAFVPRRSVRTAAVVFQRDPSCCRVVVRSLGFEEP